MVAERLAEQGLPLELGTAPARQPPRPCGPATTPYAPATAALRARDRCPTCPIPLDGLLESSLKCCLRTKAETLMCAGGV